MLFNLSSSIRLQLGLLLFSLFFGAGGGRGQGREVLLGKSGQGSALKPQGGQGTLEVGDA